jgi:hypothetical protein
MTNRRRWALVLGLVLVAMTQACTSEQPGGRKDTAAPPTSLPPSSAPPVTDHLAAVWDTAAGSYFAVAAGAPGSALLIYPAYAEAQRLDTLRADSASLTGLELELLVPGADSAVFARVAAVEPDSSGDCAAWPAVRVAFADQPPPGPWTIAFPPRHAVSVHFDSLAGLPRADSSRLTIAAARAASKVEGDTASAFRGRPFIVRQANRFRLDDGREAVLAEIVRVVTQEANPQQEQLIVMLEGETAERSGFSPAYATRQIGLEEALESVELLGVVRLRNGTWAVVLHREVGEGSRFELLEREGPGRWRLRWRSAYAGC